MKNVYFFYSTFQISRLNPIQVQLLIPYPHIKLHQTVHIFSVEWLVGLVRTYS